MLYPPPPKYGRVHNLLYSYKLLCTCTNYFVHAENLLYANKIWCTHITPPCMSTQHFVLIQNIAYAYTNFDNTLMGTHIFYTCNMVVYVSSYKTLFNMYKMVLYAYTIWYTYKIFCTRTKLFGTRTKHMWKPVCFEEISHHSYTTTRDIRKFLSVS